MSADDTPTTITGIGPIDPRWPKARKAAHLEARRIMVEQYEIDGMTARAIARLIGVDVHTAHDDIKAVREKRREAFGAVTVRQHRDMTGERLEQERRRIIADMTDDPGDPDATPPRPARSATLTRWQGHRLLLQVEKQRADLYGLNAPAKVQLQEFAPEDEGHESLDEAPKERTLGDILTANPEAATALAEVIHLSERAG